MKSWTKAFLFKMRNPKTKWLTEETIDDAVLALVVDGVMPTAPRLVREGHQSLANAVSRYGGFRSRARRLGLRLAGSETHRAHDWEEREHATALRLGLTSERQTSRAPFDILIQGVRVDVKSGAYSEYKNTHSGGDCKGYVFAGLKMGRDAEAFDLLCVDGDSLRARFLVPAESARVSTITITPLTLRGGGLYSRFRADTDDEFRSFF